MEVSAFEPRGAVMSKLCPQIFLLGISTEQTQSFICCSPDTLLAPAIAVQVLSGSAVPMLYWLTPRNWVSGALPLYFLLTFNHFVLNGIGEKVKTKPEFADFYLSKNGSMLFWLISHFRKNKYQRVCVVVLPRDLTQNSSTPFKFRCLWANMYNKRCPVP